ncbi:MAG: hypothetical protein VCB81_05690 [Verrucomicrobiia bacterium]
MFTVAMDRGGPVSWMMEFPGITSVSHSAQQVRGNALARLDYSTRLSGVDSQVQQLTARHEAQLARMMERVDDAVAGALLDLVG